MHGRSEFGWSWNLLVKIIGRLYNRDMNPIVESSAFDRAVTPALKKVFPAVISEVVFEVATDIKLASRIEELAASGKRP